MPFACIILLCLQDKASEETYRKIEEAFRQADSVRTTIKYATELVPRGPAGTVKLLLKKGGKVNLDFRWTRSGGEYYTSLVSDGSKAVLTGNGDQYDLTDTPKKLEENLALVLARLGGYYAALFSTPMISKDLHEIPDFEKALSVSEVRAAEDEGEMKALTYKVSITHPAYGIKGQVVDVKILYDAKTNKILKRQLRIPDSDGSIAETTETYGELDLNADIPEKKFKLPEKN